MYLDGLVDRAAASLPNYDTVVEYLTVGRGFSLEELKKFRIGYTNVPFLPISNDPEEEEFLDLTKKLYYLKKKILIPLENPVGLATGVIARATEHDTKFRYQHYYLREAKKTGAFFGLRQALPHIIGKGEVYVTEGSFDCMAIARHYPNTVSTLTSYINDEQMFVLRMLADKIIMVFDPDEAGRGGVETVYKKYGRKGLYHREFGHTDANDFLVKHGDDRFKAQLGRTLGSLLLF